MAEDFTGQTLGTYRVEERIGAGGMGEVYRAYDSKLDRPVAIKLLDPKAGVDPERLQRFRAEARTVSALNHPHILIIYDIGEEAGRPFMVTEFVEGVTLRQRVAQGPLPVRETIAIATQVASADEMSGDEPTLQTQSGLIVGTPEYMSPEQAAGHRVDFRSDQFSLGVVLYELVTGVSPFRRSSRVQAAAAVITDAPDALGRLCPDLPPPFRWVIERCLAKRPEDRYGTTGELHRDLSTIHERISDVRPQPLALPPTNLPVSTTPLIGRDVDVAALHALLRRDDVRWVTVTGPGGGTTRLTWQVARELTPQFDTTRNSSSVSRPASGISRSITYWGIGSALLGPGNCGAATSWKLMSATHSDPSPDSTGGRPLCCVLSGRART